MKLTQNPDGSYREDKHTYLNFVFFLFCIIAGLIITSCVADLIFGAEEMAEVQGDVVHSITR